MSAIQWLDDGRLKLVLRQSAINTFLMCPEKARRELTDPQPQRWTDLTALGTAVHAGIEYALHEQQQNEVATLDDMIEVSIRQLAHIEHWHRAKWMDTGSVYKMAAKLLGTWRDNLYLTYEPIRIEERFSLQLHEDDEMVIVLNGTPDVEDSRGVIHDHKTASASYQYDAWKRQRSAVQPTAYLYAAWQRDNFGEPMPTRLFQYDVMVHNGETETIPITRDQTHVDWLRQQCVQIGRMVLADVTPWPMIDNDWWCSEKWCDTFAAGECKGAHMTPERWLRPQLEDVTTAIPLEETHSE